MTRLLTVAATIVTCLASACSGPTEVRDAFTENGAVIAFGGGSGGAVDACISCHGLNGEGNGNLSPRLAGLSRGYIIRQLNFYAEGQRSNPQMVAVVKSLSGDERQKVATYYADLPIATSGVCGIATARAESIYRRGDPSRGIASCASCHGALGEGNAGNPPLAGQPAPYLTAQLAKWRTGERYGDPLGVMTRIGKALTPSEAAALSAYAASLPGDRGYPQSGEECPPARRAVTRNGV